MAKTHTQFVCRNCGHQSVKWVGKCPSCQEWNTLFEEVVQKASAKNTSNSKPGHSPRSIHSIETMDNIRLGSGFSELDRILGGGFILGAALLIGGEPGVGKSTLLLQSLLRMKEVRSLYVSGEESSQQIRYRASRLQEYDGAEQVFVFCENNVDAILAELSGGDYRFVVVDSVQTLYDPALDSSPGTVSQVRECSFRLVEYCKEKNIPLVLIGHINKEGIIAGPKVLEHLVDTVIQFEGDRQGLYRILRSLKNRFGSTHEMGFFEMEGSGLREVLSPSDIFISDSRDKSLSGCSVSCIMEGSRGLLVEVQALVSSAVYGTPQRVSKGYDTKKLNMVLAVLEKRCGFRLSLKDVFLNITGGFSVEDPGIDLAVVLAILSSNEDIPIDPGICVIGELGLSGEIRSVNKPDQRVLEAVRLGFTRVFIPAAQVNTKNSREQPGVIGVKNINELFTGIFG